MCSAHIYFIGVFMSKFTFAFTKEKKQNFVPNGNQNEFVDIVGCPIESANGKYYQMDPITINDKTYTICFTNGVYMLEFDSFPYVSSGYLFELDNSILKQKFHYTFYGWINSETGEQISRMEHRPYGHFYGG
jgi:hypothetical protein